MDVTDRATDRADKESNETNILACASATSASKLLRDIFPVYTDGLVGPDDSEKKLHGVFGGPGHDYFLGLLGLLDAELEGGYAWLG